MPIAEKDSKQHVAVLAFPFGTHAGPLLNLIRRISAAAPDVKFSFFSTARSNATIFSELENGASENIRPYNVVDGLPEGFVFKGNPHEPVELFIKATPDNFKSGLEEAVAVTGRKITCLVTDAFFWFAWEMAEEMEVPWIAVWTSGPRALLSHIDTDFIRQKVESTNGGKDQLLKFIPGFSEIRARDLPEGIVYGDLDSPFSQMVHKMGQMLPRAAAVAINSYEELDDTVGDELKSILKMYLNVGPFILTSPPSEPDVHGCLEWLDKHEPASVAYISFGSVITPPPHELAALAEAIEEGGFPFLWSFRGNKEDYLPKGFLERTSTNGKFVPWVPQSQVLAHSSVGAFVTHSGWNSILESKIGGVPMICRPFFGDQQLNTRTLETVWGIGVGVEGGVFTISAATKALELVLSNEEGKRMREKIKVFKELATNAVKSNGTSTGNFEILVEIITSKKDTGGDFSYLTRFYSAKSMF